MGRQRERVSSQNALYMRMAWLKVKFSERVLEVSKRAREMAQLVDSWSHKREDLSSNS